MSTSYWHIVGYDSTTKIYEKKVRYGCYSDTQIKNLLMALVSKASLDYDDIVGAYAKKGTNISNNLLDVQKIGLFPSYSCGDSIYFTAVIVEK